MMQYAAKPLLRWSQSMGTSSMDNSVTSPVSGSTGTMGVLAGEDSADCEDSDETPSKADMKSNSSMGQRQVGARASRRVGSLRVDECRWMVA